MPNIRLNPMFGGLSGEKSDRHLHFVFSFGVLLWECLTGEIPYGDINQMQVAFGIATGKYSLPIPSSCPDEFAELMQSKFD